MVLASVAVPIAVLFALKGEARQLPEPEPEPAVLDAIAAAAEQPAVPYDVELVAAPPAGASTVGGLKVVPERQMAASRARASGRILPAGVAPEQGLQVRTILTARNISAVFPEIQQIGGVRPDALRWHPNGLALDVMIANPSSAESIRLGNEIVAYVMKNADRFGIQDAIWRGVYYTPGGQKAGGYGHYDHVHITTTGGGYPTGEELYLR